MKHSVLITKVELNTIDHSASTTTQPLVHRKNTNKAQIQT